jgi:tetratricopeptide (TPR) repeat protein
LIDHPSREELAALNRETLRPERERAIWRHLLTSCKSCLAAVPAPILLMLGLEPRRRKSTAQEDVACDAAIGRAFKSALKQEGDRESQRTQVRRALQVLEDGGVEAAINLPQRIGDLARMEAFLARAWDLRHEDPNSMVHHAWIAAQLSLKLDPRRHGPARVSDLQAWTHAELGNAYRVSNCFHGAGDFLGRARAFFEHGTGDVALEARLLELDASLAADLRQFGRASTTLLKVFRLHMQRRDLHLAGRVLVKMGLYTGYEGKAEQALRLLDKGLALIEGDRDPSLQYAARHNQITFLIDCGHIREAEKKLFLLRPLCQHAGGRLNMLRFRWEEGRISAGLQRFGRAEATFRALKPEFEEVGRPFDSALVSLHLASVLLIQGKSAEAARVALEAARVFKSLDIQREAFQAVILLRNAFEEQAATLEMVEEVAGFLRRIEIDPALRFEGQAWEGPGR